jgi:cyclopropane fatty-acyl-phospholipid synthase-like methyltransferase
MKLFQPGAEKLFDNEEPTVGEFGSKSIREYWSTNPKEIDDDLSFLKWFDNYDSFKAYWSSGYIDLNQRILKKIALREIQQTYDKTSLEIGYGGGRILNAATSMFKKAYGVDVHNCQDRVSRLTPEKVNTDCLLLPEELDQKIPDNSVDIAYSFIVFQHFDSIDTFYFYANAIMKKLRPGGVFNIFYGVNSYNSDNFFLMPKSKIQKRGSSLFIKPEHAQECFTNLNAAIIEHGVASKKPWFTAEEFPSNSQAYIIGKK